MKMIKMIVVALMLACTGVASASYSYSTDFENYSLGDLNGQDGWTATVPAAGYSCKVADSGVTPAGNGKWAYGLSYPYQNVVMERTIAPDENLLNINLLWLPNDNGNPAAWGSATFFLKNDIGDEYVSLWYRPDNYLYMYIGGGTYYNSGINIGEQAFVLDIEIDYALDAQRVSVTPVATGVKQTSPWKILASGGETIASANGGKFGIRTQFGGMDDVSITSVPEPLTMTLLGLGGFLLKRRS